jgi:hypothetical protein
VVVLGTLGGFALLAVGVTIADLLRRRKPGGHIDDRRIDIGESNAFFGGSNALRTGEYFPDPDDGRPRR